MPSLKKMLSKKIKDPYVTHVHVKGMIGKNYNDEKDVKSANYRNLYPLLYRAFHDEKAEAVCITIESGGGYSSEGQRIAGMIRDFANETQKPVYAFIENTGASAAYAIACATDEIYAHQSSHVGSIGSVIEGYGIPGLLDKIGVDPRTYVSGDQKRAGDFNYAETEKGREALEASVNESASQFIEWVKSRRGDKLQEDKEELFNGKSWSGRQAKDLGLIDGHTNMQDFVKEKFGKDAKVITYFKKESEKGLKDRIVLVKPFSAKSVVSDTLKAVDEYLLEKPLEARMTM